MRYFVLSAAVTVLLASAIPAIGQSFDGGASRGGGVGSSWGGGQQASTRYRDPEGRFSAPVPEGWNTSDDNGTVQISSGADWVMLIPSTAASPVQAAMNVIHQMQSQYQRVVEGESGRPKIHGHDAAYASLRGINPKGQDVAVMVAAIQASGNHDLVFVSSAPKADIENASRQFMQILKGIRFPGDR